MGRRIDTGDDESLLTLAAAMRGGLDAQAQRLSGVPARIQPEGQLLPAAVDLVAAASQWRSDSQRWYQDRSAELLELERKLAAAWLVRRATEEHATDLARRTC